VRFRVDADSDGGIPLDKIAEEYELMVVTEQSLLRDVAERAQQLLAAGRALGEKVKVSRREREVLDGILQSLANKEIASRLNVSERTVKFHVSSLLAKFGVADRFALSREASVGRIPKAGAGAQIASDTLFGYSVSTPEKGSPMGEGEQKVPPSVEKTRARGRVFPIFRDRRFAT
jgi:DNA-binding CsgD family transcriptional regulator